ncbi:cell division/GTP binding protein [Lichtheimia hyalospora FSU 10163]|nr:cell division/GTP binding protein [Lichtheimia hyalospora FSU 10163]
MLYSAYSQKISSPARSRKEPVSYLNIMVVGQAGTGKTAFVRTLCESLKHNIIQGTLKESKPMVLKDVLRPTDDLYTVSMHVEEEGERTSLTVIDTPGFDQSIDIEQQLRYVCTYIDHQYERTLIEETKLRRDAKAVDTHIHACLYFLDTTSKTDLSDVDRYMLRVLSSRVNIIPVVGKADTLTAVQRDTIRKAYRWNFFDIFRIPVYGYIDVEKEDEEQPVVTNHSGSETMNTIMSMLKEYVEEDNDEDARAMYEYLEHFPLTSVGYEEDPETGRPVAIMRDTKTVLGRRYPWAIVECSNPDHCDFERLKSMIVSVHRDMFRIDTFERFYEKYRTKQLMSGRFEGSPIINRGKMTNSSATTTTTNTKIRA